MKTLVILAAGLGTRFGTGIKQLEPIDDCGHIIIDYSIHDAIAEGFGKIVFIIRHDIEADFRSVIGDRIEAVCRELGVEVCYAFQETEDVPAWSGKAEGRTKPWGTGHAVLSCRELVKEPFAVINADDYYGKNGFRKAAQFLESGGYGLVGYILKNTLSENGGVTRGICSVEDGKLTGIRETKHIVKTAEGAEGDICRDAGDRAQRTDGREALDVESLVSMNFWCYPAAFMDVLEKGFPVFLESMKDPMKDEYLLPVIADGMIRDGVSFTVLPTDDHWFGVTFKEDKPVVTESFRKLIRDGVYREELYTDLNKIYNY